ncbi:hypothetical protein Rhopal_002791-T1 [Rhodotorula paludigena]|uniref:Hap4 transcription factor heteromerisation domain-containing protein n=1 Tax=Rhodotorula paludigena TaxID=86838 RepID=A0AAV5GK93_9BASI|nr:hypothetical protein Rhopal_002791-T1 [Rhodotorula paludigena]
MPPAMLAAPPADRSEPKCLVKPSREWVVPPRPKPGRKSTKKDDDGAKGGGRTSQKAFRERRQEYVAELEEKVRQLEAGEGEKCVFYQQQAQKAKLETVALQQENDSLKKEVEALRRELERAQSGPAPATGSAGGRGSGAKGKARATPQDFDDSASPGPSKRPRRSAAVRAQAVVASATGTSPVASQQLYQIASAAESPVSALSPAGTSSSSAHSAYVHSPLNDFHAVGPASPAHPQLAPNSDASPHGQRCTFCSADADCFCAQVGYDINPSPSIPLHTNPLLAAASSPAAQIKLEDTDDILFAETSYEPAVPLRLRKSVTKAPTVWAIEQPHSTGRTITISKPVCSGDPSNCPACSDDPFGKAFCNALSSTVCTTQPCTNCPSHSTSRKIPTPPPEATDEEAALFESLTDLPCCGDPTLCGSLTCKPNKEGDASVVKVERAVVKSKPSSPSPSTDVETVPCNEAWTALKQHPNIAFADLQMLADVVAKRTYCGGPVVSTPPPPPGVTSETFVGRPELVPQSTLQCSIDAGARKRLTVERGAVNEALHLLDRAVARGGPLRQ